MKLEITNVQMRPGTYKDYGHRTRMYFFLDQESILENLVARHNRPWEEFKKQLIPQVAERCNLPREGLKFRWARKAGCKMCPCSPGFIVTGLVCGREVPEGIYVDYRVVEE